MNKKSHILGVVFDLDGTILDTFEHIVRAFELVLPQFGVQKNREEIRAVIGKTLHECYDVFLPDSQVAKAVELHHQTQQSPEMYELIATYEGLHTCLDKLKATGYSVAVLTNRSRRSVDLIFAYMELSGSFDLVVTADESPASKPDPRSIQFVSEQLMIPYGQLVMVGDTVVDILTAKQAGAAASVGLTHGFGLRNELEIAGADYIVDSLVKLPAIIDRVSRNER